MSERNVVVVRAMWEAFLHNDFEAGLEVNERHSELYTVRNGKIAYRKGFSDADEALNAARLAR
ncbi:MAG: hypothetical protein ACRDPL_11255 [Propionibacteriaceae bacterium]